MDKSVPRVTVWHHSAEPRDAKTMTLGTDLSTCPSHSCQILIVCIDAQLICAFAVCIMQKSKFLMIGLKICTILSPKL